MAERTAGAEGAPLPWPAPVAAAAAVAAAMACIDPADVEAAAAYAAAVDADLEKAAPDMNTFLTWQWLAPLYIRSS